MTTSLSLFLLSILGVLSWIAFRFYQNKKEVQVLEDLVKIGSAIEKENKLDDVKNLVFAFFDDIKIIVERQGKFLFHCTLHFFVIVLGFISDVFDFLYSKSRDLFLRTATKENEVVTKFWHHLKEYKREQSEEK